MVSVNKYLLLLLLQNNSQNKQHFAGKRRKSSIGSAVSIEFEPLAHEDIKVILEYTSTCFAARLPLDIHSYNLKDCCQNSLSKILHADFLKLASCQQRSELWSSERQFRLTGDLTLSFLAILIIYFFLFLYIGSRCYSIFTYSKSNWQKKCKDYFFPKHFCNEAINHGNINEERAKDVYKTRNGYSLSEVGLIVCEKYPWLAYSADGIVMRGGKPWKLLEIKCPLSGKYSLLQHNPNLLLKL